MEETEINNRIKSLILYIHSVERSDAPIEMKREKLMELESLKLHYETVLDDRKFKAFLKEYLICMTVLILGVVVLTLLTFVYGN